MEINSNKDKYYWRSLVYLVLVILTSIISIVWFLPREERQTFRYDVGRPWMYGSFIAKFDFPIYKTDEVLQMERDSALADFQPYFILNPDIERTQVYRLQTDFAEGFPGMPYEYLRIITNRLHRIYQAGIVNTPEYNELATDSTNQIRIVNGKEAESRNITYLYSTRAAYEQLFIDEELGELRQALQKCNLNEYIEPNVVYDKVRTEAEREELINSIPASNGMVVSGQKIIDRGEIVDDYTARVLASFERERTRRSTDVNEVKDTLAGQIIFVTTIVLMFTGYIILFRRDFLEHPRSIIMLYLLLSIFPILVSLVMQHNFFSVYLIPFCIAPIFVRVFLDSRTAFTTHAFIVLICASAVTYQSEFIIVQLLAGLVAIYSLREMSKRAQLLKTALFVTLISISIYYALQHMQSNELMKLDSDMYFHFFINGILLLLSYPLMYLVEKLFGFTSDVSLFELSNTNRGALRDLSEIAPGTFQHSITVGNLAAEIANKIGADSLLVRTGALYHDIGKMSNSVYFTENQAGVNPHDNLSFTDSAKMITGHVTNGISIAEKYDLPQIIKDFILTHHGKGMAKYFYVQEQNAHPDATINPDIFSYPGPNPYTQEQAILMMADTVEAASRSLKEYTEDTISELVNRLIDNQVNEGYFKECPITFRDISIAKQVLIERLKSIYHTRISYPKTREEEENEIEENIEKIFEQNDKATD